MKSTKKSKQHRKQAGTRRGGDTRQAAISLLAWNANSLFHQTPEAATKRRAHLEQAARNHQVLVISETHGDEAHFETHFPQIAKLFHIFSTIGTSWAVGGVTILVKRDFRAGNVCYT